MANADMAKGHRLLPGTTGLIDSMVETIKKFNTNGTSKVTDGNGEPLVVFHGSRRSFDQFSSKYNHGNLGNAFFFAADTYDADLPPRKKRPSESAASKASRATSFPRSA